MRQFEIDAHYKKKKSYRFSFDIHFEFWKGEQKSRDHCPIQTCLTALKYTFFRLIFFFFFLFSCFKLLHSRFYSLRFIQISSLNRWLSVLFATRLQLSPALTDPTLTKFRLLLIKIQSLYLVLFNFLYWLKQNSVYNR